MYDIIIGAYSLLVKFISLFHKKANKMLRGQRETFSILTEKVDTSAQYIWIHVSSLGEFEQARPIIERIKESNPKYKIALSFFSPSGYEVRKDYPLADIVCYLPFDTNSNAKRFVELLNPKIAIFVKYEFWLNYVSNLKKKNIPTYVVSAIFRPDQIFFKRYASFYGNILRLYTHIFVQDNASKTLLNQQGIENVTIVGDTRMDRVIQIRNQAKSIPIIEKFVKKKQEGDFPILVAGSSWPADEDIIFKYLENNKQIKLIIAPHEIHESHLKMIEEKSGVSYIRYSKATEETVKEKQCLIIDCFGLLSSIYRYGDIAYIGGGFGAGIHNLPEAAVYGMPVIFGPNFSKFAEARMLIEHKGGVSISSAEEFEEVMNTFIGSPDKRKESGKKAYEFINTNGGATEKILASIGIL